MAKQTKTLPVKAGDVLRVKQVAARVEGGVAQLRAPIGRELVVLILGVGDSGVPFDVDSMLGALGYEYKEGDGDGADKLEAG